MSGAPTPPKVLRFGDYRVDLGSGQVHKGERRINLREKSFQVLASLLERPGHVVTREELRRRLWPDDVFVDFDSNLNTAIAKLRAALFDPAANPRFIETLPKRGYRFKANIYEESLAPPPGPALQAKVVVLPFTNLSGDAAQEYFSDAVTDGIITDLGRIAPEQLAVIACTTAMHFKGSRRDVARVGRELGVDYVVEGGVHRACDRVATNARLIRAKDQVQIWAQRYDSKLSEIFKLQAGIAQAVAAKVGITPADGDDPAGDGTGENTLRSPTRNLRAYNEYVQGRYELASLVPGSLARARRHFEEAIACDPGFALAYDSLAEAYWWLGYFGFVRPIEAFSAGVLYAVRALEIDNNLAETHALLAQYHKQLDYNWPEVEREMSHALALGPNSPVVRVRYALHGLMPHGRLEEAVEQIDFALKFDPMSTYTRTGLVINLVLWHRYDRALAEAQRLIELDPNAYWGHLVIGACYRDLEMFNESIAAHRKAVEVSGHSAVMLGWLGLVLGLSGETDEPRVLLARLKEMSAGAYVPPSSFAWIHLGLGEIDSAFEWLDRAVDGRDQLMMPIKSYAFLDPLRPDPRFAALLRKMNLEA
jgi:TolB-like protein/Tfp pilus assembly protein PilF